MDRSRLARIGIVAVVVALVGLILSLAARQERTPEPEPAAPTPGAAQPQDNVPPAAPPSPPAAVTPPATGGTAVPPIAAARPPSNLSPAALPSDHPPIEPEPDEKSQVSIQWIGESEFVIDSPGQIVVVTEPFDPAHTGYGTAPLRAHLVTVSGGLPDAAAMARIGPFVDLGQKVVRLVRGETARQGDVTITPVPSRRLNGAAGSNTIYLIQAGALRIAHFGALGERLAPEQVAALGRVDVLLAPVGGDTTIGPDEAADIVRGLNPRLVIPMHYRTAATDPAIMSRLRPVDDFTTKFASVEFKDDYVALVAPNVLPRQTTVWVMKWLNTSS